jgi:hypothetical protein
MAELLVYDMTTNSEVAGKLKQVLERFNLACSDVAAYADKERQYNSRHLSAVLGVVLQETHLLPAGLAECACRRVGHDSTRLNPNAVKRQRREMVPNYVDNKWVLYSGDTVSLGMAAVEPWCTDYPVRLSLSVLKKRNRAKRKDEPQRVKGVSFRLTHEPLPLSEVFHNKEMRLYASDDYKHWSLLVAVGITDDEVAPEDDPTHNPDYQEPDYTPSEDVGE